MSYLSVLRRGLRLAGCTALLAGGVALAQSAPQNTATSPLSTLSNTPINLPGNVQANSSADASSKSAPAASPSAAPRSANPTPPSSTEQPVPPLTAHLVDTTGTLSGADRAELDARLNTIEQQSGSQVAVLIVPTTQPEDIAAYGIRVADAWKLGRKKIDDGVILIVALQDRKLRIEVGRGLEGAIPDAIAKRIIDEVITPAFKQGDYHGGIAAGIEQIAVHIGAEGLPGVKPVEATHQSSGGSAWLPLLFILFAIFAFAGRSRRGYYASRSGGSVLGSMAQGAILGGLLGGGRGGGGFGGGGGGGWSGGGGGGFGGGGASGGW